MGLDLATCTGYGRWSRGDDAPRMGSITIDRRDPALFAHGNESLRKLLSRLHAEDPIEGLFVEGLIKRRVDTLPKLKLLIGLYTMAEWWAHKLEIPFREVHMDDWRKHFIGVAKGGRDFLKKKAVAECKSRGWSVKSDDEADAAGVLDFGLACFGVTPPWRDKHLFNGLTVRVGRL